MTREGRRRTGVRRPDRGAGGGGVLMLLAKSAEAARELRARLSSGAQSGQLYQFEIAAEGLRVEINK